MKKLFIFSLALITFLYVYSAPPPGPDTGPDFFHVDVNVVGGDNDGSSRENAFSTIQDGINAAGNGDVIYVYAGTYNVGSTQTDGYSSYNRVYIDKTVSVQGVDGAATTIIQGTQASGGGHGSDAVRGVYISTGTLQGFTITGGYTQSSGNAVYDESGGGILQTGGTVQYCIIKDNSAYNHGGGIYQHSAGITQSSLIYGNSTTLANGGGVYQYTGGEIENCTVSDNTATGSAGGIYLIQGGSVYNSIVWGNTGGSSYNDDIQITTSGTVEYTCASDGITNGVNGCTTSDPDFDDASNDDYHIFIDSPCYNNGSNGLSDASYDLDGNDRILFTTIDMGAYETQGVSVTFTDGSAFSNSLVPNTTDQPFGRFQLTGDVSGATLTAATIKLEGTRSGLSNIKLWSSDDATYDVEDIQLGGIVYFDPGTSPAEFSGFSSAIKTTGTYYFLTANTGSTITGSIQGVILETADLSVFSGTINSTISSAALSGSEVPCPVTLTSFTADAVKGKVNLQWSTASEAENDHFLIIRDGEVIASVPGHGTCTEPHDYAYTDALVEPGVHQYVLADVTWGGEVTEHAPVNVEVETEIMEADFVLNKAYPNPFNPTVVLSMEYAVGSSAVLNIYNTQGILVDQLVNGFIEAGTYDITWDARNMPSGVYIVKMIAGNVMQSQKIVLMK